MIYICIFVYAYKWISDIQFLGYVTDSDNYKVMKCPVFRMTDHFAVKCFKVAVCMCCPLALHTQCNRIKVFYHEIWDCVGYYKGDDCK